MTRFFSYIGLLATVGFAGAAARADQTPFELGGSARIRAESKANADFNDSAADYTGFVGSRFRLDFKFKPKEDITVFFQPQFAKIWGDQEIVPSSATGNTPTDSSGVTNDTPMDVHQAYLSLRSRDGVVLTFGRKELSYGDQLVIGGVGWSNIGRSFDTGLATIELGPGSLDVILAKVRETNAAAAGPGDKDLSGFYSSFRLGESIQSLDAYVLISEDHAVSATTSAAGLRLKSPVGDIDYRVEATSETLKAAGSTSSGSQADLELGYTISTAAKFRVVAELFRAGENYDQLYPTGHKWLGFADLFSRRNISGFRLGFSAQALENLGIAVDYHDFRRVDTAAPAYKFGGGAYGSAGSDDAIASELDLVLTARLTGDTSGEFGFAKCDPKGYLRDNGAKDSAQFAYASVAVSF